jgi:hypothetical protein
MNTLIGLFLDSTRPFKFLLLVLYVLMGAALCLRTSGADIHYAVATLSLESLVEVCFLLAAFRYFDLFKGKSTAWSRRIVAMVGILLWCFLAVSSLIAVPFGPGTLYLVPALGETWLLARAFYEYRLGIE